MDLIVIRGIPSRPFVARACAQGTRRSFSFFRSAYSRAKISTEPRIVLLANDRYFEQLSRGGPSVDALSSPADGRLWRSCIT